ncbi:Uncharacterised protein [Enterobacter hormaechei]|nr:Uncharacterised protein [Enterobacter hormaechei]CZW80610.1 Uncharacterised protein [Enterobacter hormaechei]SAB83413.1 Uncharacterised protein [Enterobacter hormaechei]SAC26572.1 Uncharacterised protein [Enterobacter hormaechei]SAI09801.1 Uncharacterised protein [Enterobacter hormaechei]
MHDNLRLLVQFDTFVVIIGRTRRLDQVFKRLVAPARVVGTVFRCRTAEQGREEVVRIPVVAGPAHHDRLVFARFGAFQVLAPLVGHNFGLYANLRPVSLNHFRHTTCVRVVRTLYRHRPQLNGETFILARFFQQRFRFLRIVGVVLNVVVIAPHGWWDQVLGRNASALVNGFDDRFFVHRVGQRLTHFHVIERFLLGVEGEIPHVQARLLHQVDIFVLLHARDVSRVWIRHHLTFVFLQFCVTHGCVRRDGEDQTVDLRLGAPVAREGFIQNTGIFLVLKQLERAGTDWVQVHFFRRAGFQHVVRVLFRENRGEVHRQVSEEWRFRTRQHKLNGFIVHFFHFSNQVWQTHPFEVFIAAARHFMVRVLGIFLTVEGEHYVVGVKVARRFEFFAVLPLHALTQVEGIGFTVFADIPLFSQARNHFRGAGFKFNQTVIDRYRACVVSRTRGKELWVKAFRRAFRTVNQGFCLYACCDGHGHQAQTKLQHP